MGGFLHPVREEEEPANGNEHFFLHFFFQLRHIRLLDIRLTLVVVISDGSQMVRSDEGSGDSNGGCGVSCGK
jgi:hypothetical protein